MSDERVLPLDQKTASIYDALRGATGQAWSPATALAPTTVDVQVTPENPVEGAMLVDASGVKFFDSGRLYKAPLARLRDLAALPRIVAAARAMRAQYERHRVRAAEVTAIAASVAGWLESHPGGLGGPFDSQRLTAPTFDVAAECALRLVAPNGGTVAVARVRDDGRAFLLDPGVELPET